MPDEPVTEEAVAEPRATRNPPVNINVVPAAPATTAGTNVNIAGGANAATSGTANAPAGGAPTWESGVGVTATLGSISPTTKARNTGTFTVTATGTGFVSTSVIVFNGVPLDTTFVSATSLTATADSTGASAGTVNVVVQNGPTATSPQTFTYT